MHIEIWLLVFVFAVYRLSELIAKDFIFDFARRFIAKRASAGNQSIRFIAELIHCSLCLGVWIALPAAYLFSIELFKEVNVYMVFVLWLGIAGAQYLLSRLTRDRD